MVVRFYTILFVANFALDHLDYFLIQRMQHGLFITANMRHQGKLRGSVYFPEMKEKHFFERIKQFKFDLSVQGKYFHRKQVAAEVLEVIIQISALIVEAPNSTPSQTSLYASAIGFNIIGAFLLHLQPKPQFNRDGTIIFDVALECFYIFYNSVLARTLLDQ